MKTQLAFIALFALGIVSVLAQTNIINPLTAPLPQSTAQFWDFGIAAVTPVIVWFIRKLAPQIPTLFIPFSAALIGMGLALLLDKLNAANYGWYDAGRAGALSVFVREIFSQTVTKGIRGGGASLKNPTK